MSTTVTLLTYDNLTLLPRTKKYLMHVSLPKIIHFEFCLTTLVRIFKKHPTFPEIFKKLFINREIFGTKCHCLEVS